MQTFKSEMQWNSFVIVVLRLELILISSPTICGASIVHHCCEAGTLFDFIQIQEAESLFGVLAETFIYHIPYRFPIYSANFRSM